MIKLLRINFIILCIFTIASKTLMKKPNSAWEWTDIVSFSFMLTLAEMFLTITFYATFKVGKAFVDYIVELDAGNDAA